MLKFVVGGLVAASLVGCVDQASTDTQELRKVPTSLPNNLPIPNAAGFSATFNVNSDQVDTKSDFFTSFGTNGRTCGSCHSPIAGWTVTPGLVQAMFDASNGLDPIFHNHDGTNSPNVDQSTTAARRAGSSMLLTKGLIRVGIGVPSGADFDLTAVDDPYGFASSAQLSLFRRPLPSTNLQFDSTVMWDGRETFLSTAPGATADHCYQAPFPSKCFASIDYDFLDQAIGATLGHAQAMVPGLTPDQDRAIATFEEGLSTAQIIGNHVGSLSDGGATGGAENVANVVTYWGINDNFGDYRTHAPFTAKIFNEYDAWSGSSDSYRASIARGEALFNSKPIVISGVGGLNGSLGLPASFTGTCGTCHDSPHGGNHSVVAPLNIGLTDASRRTADMPLYTLTCSASGVSAGHCAAGQSVQTTDPGRALISGAWADIGKFKGPILRGLAARAPYFHNGFAADLGAVVDFYDERFGIGFSAQERQDLVNFLSSL